MADEEVVAACMPVGMLDPANIVAGSVKKPCGTCATEVWISPVTLANTTKIICVPCLIVTPPVDAKLGMHPEQLKEMRSHLYRQRNGLSDEAPN